MSLSSQKNISKKNILFIIGIIIILLSLLSFYWTSSNTECGKDQYYIPVCRVQPLHETGYAGTVLSGGIDPLVLNIFSLVGIIIGLLIIYFSIEGKKDV